MLRHSDGGARDECARLLRTDGENKENGMEGELCARGEHG